MRTRIATRGIVKLIAMQVAMIGIGHSLVLVLAAAMIPTGVMAADILDFSVSTTAQLSVDRTVSTITGTLVCSSQDEARVAAQLSQVSGRSFSLDSGSDEFECNSDFQVWSIDLISQFSDGWKPGPADALVVFSVTDPVTSDEDQAIVQVRVRNKP